MIVGLLFIALLKIYLIQLVIPYFRGKTDAQPLKS